jgi:RNA polymerase sigma-70 factor (ECF subfamily)
MNRFDAQDLLSDTLEAAYNGYKDMDGEKALLSYMFTAATRIRNKSKRKRNRETELTEPIAELFTADADAETKLEFNMMLDKVKMMNENEAQCLLLAEVEGYSRKEIMDITGLKEQTLKSILYRAKNKLRRDLEVGNG